MTVSVTCISGTVDVEVFHFPGGEPHVKLDPDHAKGHEFVIDVRGGSWDDIGTALVINDALRRSDALYVDLFIPYLPGARQDRGAPLTAKVYADAINSAEFDKVTCVDPHSDVMPGLLDRLTVIPLHDVFPQTVVRDIPAIEGLPFLICPDAGAAKRVEGLAAVLGVEVFYARKHRDFSTGKLSGFGCDPLPDAGTGIIVDDICDGGGTFVGLAQHLNRVRRSMWLWTTHGIYSKDLSILASKFEWIGCTDSFPHAVTGTVHITPVRP